MAYCSVARAGEPSVIAPASEAARAASANADCEFIDSLMLDGDIGHVENLMFEPERRITVEWGRDAASPIWQAGYPVKLAVSCDNRPGMLKQIATVISDANTNIQNIEAKTAEDHATVELVADIADLKHLERIVTGVRKIPGVRDVQRLQKP